MNKERSSYRIIFEWVPNYGTSAGFSFACDEKGNPLPFKNPESESNYKKCISGDPEIKFKCIREYHYMPNYGMTVWELLFNPFEVNKCC
jgi:hypothetical protein